MARIVLTHGRGLRGRNEDKLRDKFVRYLREGLEEAGYDRLDDHDITFLYYGDVLERSEELALAAPTPVLSGSSLSAAGRALGASVRRLAFDDDVEGLGGHLAEAGGSDPRVCTLAEERVGRPSITSDDADNPTRKAAVESVLEERTNQLLNDPAELRSVLEQQFSPHLDDDDAIRRDVQDLDRRVGTNPRDTAIQQAVEETGRDDPDRVDALLRSWIVEPAVDAVAGLRALRRVLSDHGVDLRERLSEWQRGVVQEVLTRWEGTDFGRQWATVFDVIAVIANNSMLDGLYIMHRMRDVENYFRIETIRNEVRGLFRDVLENHDEPTILVAHSLGSVIAYDALREHQDLNVSGFVTLGSPLSIDHFRRHLARPGESPGKLPVPPMLGRWVNVYSEMDPLTLGSGIQRYFRGGGPKGRGPVDRHAENTGYLDAHSPDQYLRSNVTAEAIITMIAQATVQAAG